MELAIDTSTEIASLALAHHGQLRAELTWHAGQNHTAELVPNLIYLLGQQKTAIGELEAVVVAKGPGSFNGLRVGVSTAKGLVFALSLPLVGISTLEVQAYAYAMSSLTICPMLNAGRGEVAAALFQSRGGWRRLVEEQLTTIEALSAMIEDETIFCGELTPGMAQELKTRLGERAVLAGAASVRRAGYLAELGWQRLERGERDDPATLQPLYLRRPSVTSPRGQA